MEFFGLPKAHIERNQKKVSLYMQCTDTLYNMYTKFADYQIEIKTFRWNTKFWRKFIRLHHHDFMTSIFKLNTVCSQFWDSYSYATTLFIRFYTTFKVFLLIFLMISYKLKPFSISCRRLWSVMRLQPYIEPWNID